MNKQVFIGCAFAIGFANATISAQEKKQEKVKILEEVVVTATKFNLKKSISLTRSQIFVPICF